MNKKFQITYNTHFRFLVIAALLVALFLAACGSDSKKKKSYTVGIISPNPVAEQTVAGFKAGMAASGYTEGQNITYFVATTTDELSKQVSANKLDLLVVVSATFSGAPTNSLTQAKALANGKIPIVLASGSGDPLKTGDIESIAHPGKNMTGLLLFSLDVKRFELFANMLPGDAKRVAVIYDPANVNAAEELPEIETLAKNAGLELEIFADPMLQPGTAETASLDVLGSVDGIFLLKVWGTSLDWFRWAYEHRIPSSQDSRWYSDASLQPLMTYGPLPTDTGKRAATYATQILRGTKPGDLPMQYDDPVLSIDLGVAEGMGFQIPEASLKMAQEILRSKPPVLAALPTAEPGGVTHPAGSGACAAQQITMAGTFTVCITASCEKLLDSGVLKYTDKVEVGGCSTEKLVGTCATEAFDIHYYDGEPSSLQIGCGFLSGKWSLAGG